MRMTRAELARLADRLLADLARCRFREADLRAHYLRLLTAARATVAAANHGEADPLVYLRHELDRHGQLPADGQAARRVLADAAAAQALLDKLTAAARASVAASVAAAKSGGHRYRRRAGAA